MIAFVVVTLVATQEGAPPQPEAPAEPTPAVEPAPAQELQPEPTPPAPPPAQPAPPMEPKREDALPKDDFFAEGNVGHYLSWYGADYLALAAVGTLYAVGTTDFIEPMPAL